MYIFIHPETEKHEDCMQHYPCCPKSSNGCKLISKEKLCLICLKPVSFSNCLGGCSVLTSGCIILKMGTCWYTAKRVEEAVCDLALWVSCDTSVVCVMC